MGVKRGELLRIKRASCTGLKSEGQTQDTICFHPLSSADSEPHGASFGSLLLTKYFECALRLHIGWEGNWELHDKWSDGFYLERADKSELHNMESSRHVEVVFNACVIASFPCTGCFQRPCNCFLPGAFEATQCQVGSLKSVRRGSW